MAHTTYNKKFHSIEHLLLNLLDTPVIEVHHIGSTTYNTSAHQIIDCLVIVPNLHAMTTLDEKRLNQAGFYRMHHSYHKKCVFSQFDQLTTLNETVRLHIMEPGIKSETYTLAHNLLYNNLDLQEEWHDYKSSLQYLQKEAYEIEKAKQLKLLIAKHSRN